MTGGAAEILATSAAPEAAWTFSWRAMQDENLRQQELTNERLRATAAIRNAEAAIYGALTPSVYYYPVNVGGNVGVPASAPSSPTVAPPFTPNTVYMVRSNKVQLIRGKTGMPPP
jgi:hypothetical protein